MAGRAGPGGLAKSGVGVPGVKPCLEYGSGDTGFARCGDDVYVTKCVGDGVCYGVGGKKSGPPFV